MTKTTTTKNIVLYVDDDDDDLALVKESFARYTVNVEVVTFREGMEALNYLRRLSEGDASPCLIIIDINMPRMNGKEFLTEIRKMERFKSTPAVLFTTSSMPDDKAFAAKHDAGFITKPLDLEQMEMITGLFVDQCTDEIKKNIRKYL